MIQVYVNARAAVVKRREKLTSGTVGLKALFEFDSAWEGLYPIFNFNGSGASVDAGGSENVTSTDHTVEVTIPHECLTEYGGSLTVGVYGARVTNGETVLAIPTIYATLGQIEQGTEVSGETSAAATPTAVQQILSAVGTMNQWDNISGKPSAYPPSAHNHAQADVTGLTAALAAKQDKLTAGTNVTISGNTISATDTVYDDTALAARVTTIEGKEATWNAKATAESVTAVSGRVTVIEGKESGWDAKQDAIADLSTIRQGSALGATAVQPVSGKRLVSDDDIAAVAAGVVPTDDITANTNARHTHSNKEALDYITMLQLVKWNAKQDKLIAGSGITIAEDGKTISSTGGGGGGSTAWADITGKPSTFPPSAHEHTVSEITDFPSNIGAYIGDTEPADAETGALWVDTDDNSGSQENRPKYRLYKTVTIEQDVLEYSEEFEGDVTGFYVVVKSPGTVATQLLLRACYTKNGEQNEGIYLNNVFVTSGVRYGDVEADIKDGMLTIEGHMYSTALGGMYGTFTRNAKVDLIDKIDRFYAKANTSGTTIPTGTEFTIYVRR